MKSRLLSSCHASYRSIMVCLLICLASCGLALAKDNPSRTQIGQNITIGSNEKVTDVTCLACNIYVRGQIAGAVTAIAGSIFVEDQAQVAGDLTAVAGSVRIEKTATVAGDATVVGGEMRREAGSEVSGDVTTIGGRGWMPLILISPFLFLGLLAALIVWGVKRTKRPAVAAPAAQV
jgi:cytoskeletal protein CcmA (bactofilin family)